MSLRDNLKNNREAIPQGTREVRRTHPHIRVQGGFITVGDSNLAAVLTAGSASTTESAGNLSVKHRASSG